MSSDRSAACREDNHLENEVKRRLQALFTGHVQGVGFRFTAVEIARGFPVTGYVQNLLDGSVQVVVEGDEESIHAFLAALRRSHVFRYVTGEQLTWATATGERTDFSIRYA